MKWKFIFKNVSSSTSNKKLYDSRILDKFFSYKFIYDPILREISMNANIIKINVTSNKLSTQRLLKVTWGTFMFKISF